MRAKDFAMDSKLFISACAIAFLYFAAGQNNQVVIPATRFTCQGRVAGYYADIDTGCQVYHMCDAIGRKFSYSCPNTTLFQQRMLVCDHWYMVNCTNSENDYDANLLIGQRDKPFVSDEDMRLRTPRPDILSVPPNNNYYDGLKEAESKYSLHQGNSISEDDDSISSANNNDLNKDSQHINHKFKSPQESNFVQTTPKFPTFVIDKDENTKDDDTDINVEESSSSKKIFNTVSNQDNGNISSPSRDLVPPFLPPTTTESTTDEFNIDIRMKPIQNPVFNFIKRFDPNSLDSLNTSMSKGEIIDINKHLPAGQASAEDERTPRKNKNFINNRNVVESDRKKGISEESRVNAANIKSNVESTDISRNESNVPSLELLPPKTDYTPIVTTTMGPPIYFEWKWAVPAFDLEPPKVGNLSKANVTHTIKKDEKQGKRPFYTPRTTTEAGELKTENVEYNISSYFVPDYVFPLDGPHPGYEDENAQTSFQVKVSRPGRASYGENPKCPQCHPAFVKPGTCEPCIVKR